MDGGLGKRDLCLGLTPSVHFTNSPMTQSGECLWHPIFPSRLETSQLLGLSDFKVFFILWSITRARTKQDSAPLLGLF